MFSSFKSSLYILDKIYKVLYQLCLLQIFLPNSWLVFSFFWWIFYLTFSEKKLWKTLKWLNAPPYKKSLLNVLFIYSLELYMSFTVFELIYSIVSIRKLIIIMIFLLKMQINCVQNVTDYCLEDRTVYKFSSVFLIVCIALVLWIILWTGCNILLVS